MKLKLQAVKSTGSGDWAKIEEHGTLKSQLVKTDVLSFSNKNLEGDKRVVLFIAEKDSDTPNMLSLSERVSKAVRKALASGASKIAVIKSLLGLKVIENEDGVFYLTHEGKPAEGFSLGELTDEKVVAFEDLI